jgi:hypothetical protein
MFVLPDWSTWIETIAAPTDGSQPTASACVVCPESSNMLAVGRNLWHDGWDPAEHADDFMARRLR